MFFHQAIPLDDTPPLKISPNGPSQITKVQKLKTINQEHVRVIQLCSDDDDDDDDDTFIKGSKL